MSFNPYNQEHEIRRETGIVHSQVYHEFISDAIHEDKEGQHTSNVHGLSNQTQDYPLIAASISQSKCHGVVADESKLPRQQTE